MIVLVTEVAGIRFNEFSLQSNFLHKIWFSSKVTLLSFSFSSLTIPKGGCQHASPLLYICTRPVNSKASSSVMAYKNVSQFCLAFRLQCSAVRFTKSSDLQTLFEVKRFQNWKSDTCEKNISCERSRCSPSFTHRYLKYFRLANTPSGRNVKEFDDKPLFKKYTMTEIS